MQGRLHPHHRVHGDPYRHLADVDWATAVSVEKWNNRRPTVAPNSWLPESSRTTTMQRSAESCNPHMSGTKPKIMGDSPSPVKWATRRTRSSVITGEIAISASGPDNATSELIDKNQTSPTPVPGEGIALR